MRLKILRIATLFPVLVFSPNAWALSCDAIMKHGMTNIKISKSAAASVSTKYFNHCHKDFSSMSKNTLATLSVEVIGYGGGDGSFSEGKARTDLVEWCKTNKERAESSKDLYEESREIYGQAVEAWSKCNKLASQGIQVDVEITPNNQAIDIGLRDNSPGTPGVEYFGISQDGFTCTEKTPSGQKATDQSPIMITSSAINISCRRNASKLVSRKSGEYQVTEWGRVTVQSASGPFQFYFAQSEEPTLPTQAALKMQSQIDAQNNVLKSLAGAVVAFNLSDCPNGWQEYRPAYGRFLRGIDKGNTGVDPNGRRSPSSLQNDSLQDHAHLLYDPPKSAAHAPSNANGQGYHNGNHGHNVNDTGLVANSEGVKISNETRPKNTAVLFCEKSQ